MQTKTLERFADEFLHLGWKEGAAIPAQDTIMFIEGVSGITLVRQPPFQVQLFIVHPNVLIPEHSHPNVDSIEVFLYGIELTRERKKIITLDIATMERDGCARMAYKKVRIRPGVMHGGIASQYGGAFLSIQQWIDDIPPSSIASNWCGESMGKQHHNIIL